ncbi:hypothetical protein GGR16_004740 [Chelatococcus caeni]|uniref:Ryanodine receptor Ryr domain-containing protein n=1 Tax=Chelatococcus caeni TaxID=1348468 RepID=A0A840C296_9HYPH|nr:hypothetical protein [Chelatococcus caeni]MBB4019685.1 hypothetical protein [Chelatococcus caeni]
MMDIPGSGQSCGVPRSDALPNADKWRSSMERSGSRAEPFARETLVAQVAALGHDAWRAERRRADGGYEPRVKEVKDEAWMARSGRTTIDIANTDYRDLPSDWQAENKASAEVAVDCVLKAFGQGGALDGAFVERAAEVVHDAWLARNGAWAPEEQKLPYPQLTEAEKDKDRFWIRNAVALVANPAQNRTA